VTADSKRSWQWYFDRTGKEATLIPYGAAVPKDTEPGILKRHDLSPGRYVLFVGRLVPEKGAHTVVEAFKKVKGDIRLVVVGDTKNPGEYVERLKRIADNRTSFLGFVHGSECNALRNEALIYVHPSLFDGTSISLLYALAAGKGILSSDIEDNVEVAGEAAVYFRAEDSNDLAQQLQRLIDNPRMISELGVKARTRVKNLYDWDRIADDYEKIYSELQDE
jgi:glycosyltransferase involved in cell wall biosynthesis